MYSAVSFVQTGSHEADYFGIVQKMKLTVQLHTRRTVILNINVITASGKSWKNQQAQFSIGCPQMPVPTSFAEHAF